MNAGNHRYASGSSVRIGAKTRLKIVTRTSDTLGTGGFFAKNYKGFNIIFPIDGPGSNSTIPPIASAALLRERGR